MDTPVIPRPRILKNRYGYEIAELEKPIATGGFGEIWLATLRNPLSLLARRIVLGEEDARILNLDIPFTSGKRMMDGAAIQRVYTTAQQYWNEIQKMGLKKGMETYEGVVQMIDPVLLENPHIAVKLLKPPKMVAPEDQKHMQETQLRFQQESNLLKRFAHPNEHKNIIRRYGLVNDPEMGECLLQEFIEGPTLEEHLKAQEGRKMHPKAALEVIVQLADAVNRIHREGIIHRDLKPSNIMLRKKDNSPVIIDFGISKSGENSNLTMDKIIGTPRYMSPEQLNGQVDSRTDVYSLATILFEMIAGAPAYGYPEHNEVVEKLRQPAHPTRIVQYARNLNPFLRQLIEAGRAKNADARLTDEEFLDAIKEVIQLGKFYQDPPLGASSTVIKKERSKALRRIKMTNADVATLEQELQACALGERVNNIKQYLDQDEFTRAKEEIDKLQQELTTLPERDEELQMNLDKYAVRLKEGIAFREVQTHMALASEARKTHDYVLFGDALALSEKALVGLSEKQRATLGEVHKSLCKEYDDNFKLHVGRFRLAKDHLGKAEEAYTLLELAYTGKKNIVNADITSLLTKIEETESELKDHKHPEKVGPEYHLALTAADDLRKKTHMLNAFGTVMSVLNEVHGKYKKLDTLYGTGNLVDRTPMEHLLTQLDSLTKDIPIYDPSKKSALYSTAAGYAKELREVIADLHGRVAPPKA